jgi:diguanylate cyclase (GGDEF)-like protein
MDASLDSAGDGAAESPRFVWLTAAVLFGVGATIGALSLVATHPDYFDDEGLWSNIAVSYGVALFCALGARRLPRWPLQILILVGIAVITRAAYFSGDPDGFYALFYVWIGLFSVFFFSRRVALLHLVAIGVAYAWLVIELGTGAALARWITTIGTIALGAVMFDMLVGRLRRIASESTDLARERAELMEALEEVARTDDLTGLPNRRAWDEALERELARAHREGTPVCVGLADLDRFKHYNDRHGHQAGDRLLKQIAAAWGNELRTTDVLARYGGEEFALALPGCDIEDGRALAERLRSSTPEDQTCSVGLVTWDGRESTEELFGRADRALYAAKEAGRDRTIVG